MVKENKQFDLCSLITKNLIENVRMSLVESYPFWFGSLLICLVFYFLSSLPLKENVKWKSGIPIRKQVYMYL